MRGPVPGASYHKIKQGFLVNAEGTMVEGVVQERKENAVFVINIEPRCKCKLHLKYQEWIKKCEEEAKEEELKK